MEIKFNTRRALEIFRLLDHLWRDKEGIFKNIVLSQNRWPEPEKQIELANYLFCAALFMRGARNSDDPFRWLSKLWQQVPQMFNPTIVARDWPPERIQETIRTITPEILKVLKQEDRLKNGAGALGYKLEDSAKFWHRNLTLLAQYWDSNILNAFWGVTEFEEFYRRVNEDDNPVGFRGMKRKIFSLFTIWLQERKIIPVFPTPLPIDHHALRIMTATKIVQFQDVKKLPALAHYFPALKDKMAIRAWDKKLNDPIAIWSQKFLVKHGISHHTINPALWVISRDLCSNQLQNTTRKDGQFFFTPELIKENPKLWPKRYKDPCRFCPIERFCSGVAPSYPYHKRGLLVPMARVSYSGPYEALLPGDWGFIPLRRRRRSIPKNNQ